MRMGRRVVEAFVLNCKYHDIIVVAGIRFILSRSIEILRIKSKRLVQT